MTEIIVAAFAARAQRSDGGISDGGIIDGGIIETTLSDVIKATPAEQDSRKRRPTPIYSTPENPPAPSQEGKGRSRCSSFRHGLTCRVTVITDPNARLRRNAYIQAQVEDLAH